MLNDMDLSGVTKSFFVIDLLVTSKDQLTPLLQYDCKSQSSVHNPLHHVPLMNLCHPVICVAIGRLSRISPPYYKSIFLSNLWHQ